MARVHRLVTSVGHHRPSSRTLGHHCSNGLALLQPLLGFGSDVAHDRLRTSKVRDEVTMVDGLVVRCSITHEVELLDMRLDRHELGASFVVMPSASHR